MFVRGATRSLTGVRCLIHSFWKTEKTRTVASFENAKSEVTLEDTEEVRRAGGDSMYAGRFQVP